MSDTAIIVENLGKSYLVGHQAAQAERYTALRDVVARNVRILARKTRDMLHGRPIVQGDEVEEFWALKDVSFEVKQGETLGIIGRNGAGKSTLLKVLSRITELTQGRITLNGRVASLLEVGTGFHPELTGRENIFLNGAILGMTRREIQRKFDEIVAFAEVEQFLDTPVKRYSSGMYVRLAFAVAAHLEPEILVVDEVLAVGDMQFQSKCMGKMGEVSKEGRTILFVSHNLAAIKDLCDSVMLLDSGRNVMHADANSVTNHYLESIALGKTKFQLLVTPTADILDISLCDEAGNILEGLDTDTEIYFTIKYRIKIASRTNMVINLSKDGGVVFQSINNHDAYYPIRKERGLYKSTCCLPAGYLNNGRYVLSLTIFEDNYMSPKDFRDVISFNIADAPSVRGDYFGGLLGCTRPLLTWSTTKNARQNKSIR
jgi:lipopolysaccharide transport system ATP-binding protein